ncbi:MAG: hypothetical protein IJU68_01545 [Bacteroidales bacterium]|nr:hypothetical protein [Bacteroidales bacterium]
MERKDKIMYEAPTTTIVDVKFEGVICLSGGLDDPADYNNGGDPFDF